MLDSLDTLGDAQPSTSDTPDADATAEDLRPVFERLRAQLAEFDTEALDRVRELGARLGGSGHEAAVSRLQQLVENFDFEEAQTTAEQLASELGIDPVPP